jgi:hypothetical protein
MTVTQAESTGCSMASSSVDALAYEAPFLIEKLLKEHIVETAEEGEILFTEVKRFLVLVHADRSKVWDMYSLRVDEVWHHFILFTQQYMDFCQRFFGRYMSHSPSNAPESQTMNPAEATSYEDFQGRYRKLFGTSLPDAWFDEKSVKLGRRILNDRAATLTLRDEGELVSLLTQSGELLVSANEFAQDALAFIARMGAFYVREVPGLDDEEKVALVATLVEHNVLRVGA